MADVYAVCETEGCGNAGIGIPVPEAAVVIVCGVCSEVIYRVETEPPPEPEEPEEVEPEPDPEPEEPTEA